MQIMQDFVMWFIRQLPVFLMSEPICYFVGVLFLLFVVRVIVSMTRIR